MFPFLISACLFHGIHFDDKLITISTIRSDSITPTTKKFPFSCNISQKSPLNSTTFHFDNASNFSDFSWQSFLPHGPFFRLNPDLSTENLTIFALLIRDLLQMRSSDHQNHSISFAVDPAFSDDNRTAVSRAFRCANLSFHFVNSPKAVAKAIQFQYSVLIENKSLQIGMIHSDEERFWAVLYEINSTNLTQKTGVSKVVHEIGWNFSGINFVMLSGKHWSDSNEIEGLKKRFGTERVIQFWNGDEAVAIGAALLEKENDVDDAEKWSDGKEESEKTCRKAVEEMEGSKKGRFIWRVVLVGCIVFVAASMIAYQEAQEDEPLD
jgi:hypothetical protein